MVEELVRDSGCDDVPDAELDADVDADVNGNVDEGVTVAVDVVDTTAVVETGNVSGSCKPVFRVVSGMASGRCPSKDTKTAGITTWVVLSLGTV